MPMTPKEIVRLLEQNGFVLVGSNGSHRKYHNPATGKTTMSLSTPKTSNPAQRKISSNWPG